MFLRGIAGHLIGLEVGKPTECCQTLNFPFLGILIVLSNKPERTKKFSSVEQHMLR